MNFFIFVILPIVAYYYLKHQMRQYTIRQRKRKEELEEQNLRQKIQRYTSQLKTFVLNNYGSDGGYWNFNVKPGYIEKNSNGTWTFYILRCWEDDIEDYFDSSCRSDYKEYDTPYQAKLAGQKFTNKALKSLGY